MFRFVSVLCALVCLTPPIVEAQSSASGLPDGLPSRTADQPVLSRSQDGQTTVRVTRITTPIVLDGQLKEEVYSTVPMIDGFLQQEPEEGEPGTEGTHAWLMFDDRNIYVSAR